jgi:hypothetical protein
MSLSRTITSWWQKPQWHNCHKTITWKSLFCVSVIFPLWKPHGFSLSGPWYHMLSSWQIILHLLPTAALELSTTPQEALSHLPKLIQLVCVKARLETDSTSQLTLLMIRIYITSLLCFLRVHLAHSVLLTFSCSYFISNVTSPGLDIFE